MGFPDAPIADLAIVGDPMDAVIAAVRFRRAGITVQTYLSGSRKRQYQRAKRDAHEVVNVEDLTDKSWLVEVLT